MPTYRLSSSRLVHAPGLIEWAINAYAFPRHRTAILRVVTETWPGLPEEHAVLLLSQGLSYQLDDDTVVLDVPESSDIASPANIGPRATSGKARKVEQ
jgi:hypothetical protein